MSHFSKTTATPYCKVCHDAGKEESVYLSHFIRESKIPGSKVVCPTLLAQECRYCFKTGHTVKYCKEIKRVQMKKNQQVKKEQAIAVEHKSNNIYHALTFDEESDIEENQNENEQITLPLSYKNIIEITKKQVLQEEIEAEKRKEEMQRKTQEETDKKTLPIPVPIPAPIYIRRACTINWADDSTSDEDY